MTTPWTFARCDTRWCQRGVDLDFDATVCDHDRVSCEGCRPEDACDECAGAEWGVLADPFDTGNRVEDFDSVTTALAAHAERERAASRWVLGGGDRG